MALARLTPSETILQRVDVEAGVGLVEHGELRLEQLELEDLVALLLAAREALVDVALRRTAGPCAGSLIDALTSLVHVRIEGASPSIAVLAVRRKFVTVHAGDLDRVLHREEQARAGPLVDRSSRARPRRRA